MIVKLLIEHHLESLSLKWGCTGLSESTLVKMSNCWKSHAASLITFDYLIGGSRYKFPYLSNSVRTCWTCISASSGWCSSPVPAVHNKSRKHLLLASTSLVFPSIHLDIWDGRMSLLSSRLLRRNTGSIVWLVSVTGSRASTITSSFDQTAWQSGVVPYLSTTFGEALKWSNCKTILNDSDIILDVCFSSTFPEFVFSDGISCRRLPKISRDEGVLIALSKPSIPRGSWFTAQWRGVRPRTSCSFGSAPSRRRIRTPVCPHLDEEETVPWRLAVQCRIVSPFPNLSLMSLNCDTAYIIFSCPETKSFTDIWISYFTSCSSYSFRSPCRLASFAKARVHFWLLISRTTG